MRTLTALLIAVLVLSGTAFADEGFVIDTRDPKTSANIYDFSEGELKVSKSRLRSEPILVIRFAGEGDQSISIFSIHPGTTIDMPLEKPNAQGFKEPYGVIRVREFSVEQKEVHPEPTGPLAEFLKLGKRFVIGNIELVIYKPDSAAFRADLLNPRTADNDLEATIQLPDMSDLSQPNFTRAMSNDSWISGSL